MKQIVDLLVPIVEDELGLINLKRNSRYGEYSRGRAIAYKILRVYGFSYQSIGLSFNRHHSTIMYSIGMIETYLSQDNKLMCSYVSIKNKFLMNTLVNEDVSDDAIIEFNVELSNMNNKLAEYNLELYNKWRRYKKYDGIIDAIPRDFKDLDLLERKVQSFVNSTY